MKPLKLFIRGLRLLDRFWLGYSLAGNVPKFPEFHQSRRSRSRQLGVPDRGRESLVLYPELDLLDRVRFGPWGYDYVGNERAQVDPSALAVGHPGMARIYVQRRGVD